MPIVLLNTAFVLRHNIYGIPHLTLRQTRHSCCINWPGDGVMDLEEYCAFKKKKVAKMFRRTDRDHNKKIDVNELALKLKDIIGRGAGLDVASDMLREHDKDYNGLDKDGEYDVTGSYGRVCLTSKVLIPRWI